MRNNQSVKLCIKTTRKRSSCKNYAMNGSDYCYVHSFGRFKGIPFWKNINIHLFLASALLTVFFFFIGPSRGKQNDILKDVRDNKDLLKDIAESYHSEELLKKYPVGYVLFGLNPSMNYEISSEKRLIPHTGHLLDEYEFKWDRVRISKLTKDAVTIELPDIRYKPLNGQMIGCAITIKRDSMSQPSILPLKPEGVKNRIFIELVKDTNSMLIFAIGFKPSI